MSKTSKKRTAPKTAKRANTVIEIAQPEVRYLLPQITPIEGGHRANVNTICISQDGVLASSGSADGWLLITEIHTATLVGEIDHHSPVMNVMWLGRSKKHRFLASSTQSGLICIWRVTISTSLFENLLLDTYELSEAALFMEYSPASRRLLVTFGSYLTVLSLSNDFRILGEEKVASFNCDNFIKGAVFLTSGMYCLLSIHESQSLEILAIKETEIGRVETLKLKYEPHFIAASADSMSVAVADSAGFIHIYDWHADPPKLTERASIPYPRYYQNPLSITFSFVHGSQLLLIGSERHEAIVINLATQRRVATLEHHEGCYVHTVTAWYDHEQAILLTGSSHGRYYMVTWRCSISDITATNNYLQGTIYSRRTRAPYLSDFRAPDYKALKQRYIIIAAVTFLVGIITVYLKGQSTSMPFISLAKLGLGLYERSSYLIPPIDYQSYATQVEHYISRTRIFIGRTISGDHID